MFRQPSLSGLIFEEVSKNTSILMCLSFFHSFVFSVWLAGGGWVYDGTLVIRTRKQGRPKTLTNHIFMLSEITYYLQECTLRTLCSPGMSHSFTFLICFNLCPANVYLQEKYISILVLYNLGCNRFLNCSLFTS